MPKWRISDSFTGTTWYVTLSADPSISFRRISGVSFGKTATLGANPSVAISNVITSSGATSTLFYGGLSLVGDAQIFDDGISVKADQNAFVTVTWAASQTGTISVSYDVVRK